VSAFGFITMAYGPDRFIRQAETLARALRRHMPGMPLALVTDRTDPGDLFDVVVPMLPFSNAGTLHKISMYEYSPFEETLFVDSDCIVVRPFHEQLAAISRYEFAPIVNKCLKAGEQDLWLEDVGKALEGVNGTCFPKFNGGVYFFRKGDEAAQIFRGAHEILSRASELGVKNFDQAGPGDETLIGLAMAQRGDMKLFDDGGGLMRTPLNTQGPIEVSVLTGECSMVKEGRQLSPAIVHYCGPWIRHPTYQIASEELISGRRASSTRRGWLNTAHVLANVKERIGRRLARQLGDRGR
jgi:hypothetical protein